MNNNSQCINILMSETKQGECNAGEEDKLYGSEKYRT